MQIVNHWRIASFKELTPFASTLTDSIQTRVGILCRVLCPREALPMLPHGIGNRHILVVSMAERKNDEKAKN